MSICIAGMGRSGTSLCAQLLYRCGLSLGPHEDFIPADEGNADGYWENARFVALDDDILRAFHGAWDAPPLLGADWCESEQLEPMRERARALIEMFAGEAHWGWKDPRTSLTMPFWRALIPGLKVVICVRHPLEVVISLSKRHYFSYALGMRLWYEYNRAILDAVPPEERVITHYNAYFANPQAEFRRVLRAVGMPANGRRVARACSAIAPNLRHARYTAASLAAAGVQAEVVELYRRLCLEAGMDDDAHAREATSDDETDVRWFMGTRDAPERGDTRRYIESIEQDREALRQYLAGVERDRTEVRAYLEEVQRDRDGVRAYLSNAEDQRDALLAYLTDVERDRDGVRAENTTLHRAIANHLATIRSLSTDTDRYTRVTTSLVDTLQQTISEQAALLRDARQENATLLERIAAVQAQTATLRAEIAALRASLAEIKHSLPARVYRRLRAKH